MSAVAAVFVSLAVILVITALLIVVFRMHASPKGQYRRELRGIRRIRKGTRAGDPNATTIGVNSDVRAGYSSGSVGP